MVTHYKDKELVAKRFRKEGYIKCQWYIMKTWMYVIGNRTEDLREYFWVFFSIARVMEKFTSKVHQSA